MVKPMGAPSGLTPGRRIDLFVYLPVDLPVAVSVMSLCKRTGLLNGE